MVSFACIQDGVLLFIGEQCLGVIELFRCAFGLKSLIFWINMTNPVMIFLINSYLVFMKQINFCTWCKCFFISSEF